VEEISQLLVVNDLGFGRPWPAFVHNIYMRIRSPYYEDPLFIFGSAFGARFSDVGDGSVPPIASEHTRPGSLNLHIGCP